MNRIRGGRRRSSLADNDDLRPDPRPNAEAKSKLDYFQTNPLKLDTLDEGDW